MFVYFEKYREQILPSFNKRNPTTLHYVVSCVFRFPRPVRVEMLEQRDEEDGLTEKFVQRNEGFRQDREKEPRFAPPGSFEFEFGQKHRQIDEMEKEKNERVKQEMDMERQRLAEEMETAIFDFQAEQIRQGI